LELIEPARSRMPEEEGTMSKTPIKLTETERTTIVNALTVAARQYEIDAERASELAMHGMTVFEPAEKLAKSSGNWRPTLDNYATKSRFFGSTFSFEHWGQQRPPFSVTLGSRRKTSVSS
jgi:hypothetical protein